MEIFFIRVVLLLQCILSYKCKQKIYSKSLKLDKNVFTSIFYKLVRYTCRSTCTRSFFYIDL